MKKKIKIAIGCLVMIAVAFVYAHIAKTHNLYDQDVDTSAYFNTGIVTETGVTQQFVSEEEFLDGVKIKSTIFKTAEHVTFHYSLKDVETREVVAKGIRSGEKVKNSKFFKLEFDRVENCKGKAYELTVYLEGAAADEGVGFSCEPKTEKGTKLTIDGMDIEDGTLVMKTVTDRFDLETFVVFLAFAVYVILFMRFLYRLFK